MNRNPTWIRVLLVLFFLAGCTPTGPSTAEPLIQSTPAQTQQIPVGDNQWQVALVMKTMTNPFFADMEKGARQAERELGIHLIVKTASQETSAEQQIEIIEDLINEKVNAIVIAPIDSTRLIPVLKKASDAGIILINVDNRIDGDIAYQMGLAAIPFVGVDNRDGAYQAARELSAHITRPMHVAVVEGIREAKNADDRKEGALQAFRENANIRVTVMKTAHWKIDEAYQVAQEIFAEDPDVGAIYCVNDMMALGVLQYLDDSNRKNILLGGFDALDAARQAIHDGRMVSTVDQRADQQGYQSVVYAVRALNGGWIPFETKENITLITQRDLK